MIKIFKSHLSLCAFTTAIFFFVHNADARVETSGNGGFSCNKSNSSYWCNDGKCWCNHGGWHEVSGKTYHKTVKSIAGNPENSSESSENVSGNASGVPRAVAIEVSKEKTHVKASDITVSGEGKEGFWDYGVKVKEGTVILINSTLRNVVVGIANKYGVVEMQGGSINAFRIGVNAIGEELGVSSTEKENSSVGGAMVFPSEKPQLENTQIVASGQTPIGKRTVVSLKNTNIKTGKKAISLLSDKGAHIKMNGGMIDFTDGIGIETGREGKVFLRDVSIVGKGTQEPEVDVHSVNSAFYMSGSDGYLDVSGGHLDIASAHGLLMLRRDNHAYIDNVTFIVNSDAFYGMHFLGEIVSDSGKKAIFPGKAAVHLKKTTFTVPNSVALYSSKFDTLVKLSQDSKISGDLLLRAEDNSTVDVLADASILVGGARVDESSLANLRLTNNSKWILSRPQQEKLQALDSPEESSISALHLIDSSLLFEKTGSHISDGYQTLRIGKGVGTVYSVKGDVNFYLNTYLDKGGDLKDQKTDRLLIHGDIDGQTTVHVQSVSGSPGGFTGSGGNNQGISIIQVSGAAEKDSFQLSGGYVALNGLPYKYRLYAYGPKSELGKANSAQRLVEGKGDFWDFRLENQYVKPTVPTDGFDFPERSDGFILPERIVRSVVPQVPTYLLLPNSLFHVGLMDIGNQNKQLETLRMNAGGMLEIHENPALFLRGYGGHYRYASDLSALEYGYGGYLRYNAVKAGILLKTLESADNVVSFGVMGSYGKLSLQPKNVKHSEESAFDKWSVTAYSTLQHDAGFYVDGLLSYGLFKGDVVTLARGKTATLKSKPLSVSLTGGQSFATGYEGFVVDPQVQVVYQNLQFDKARDIDNFDIEMGKLDQWVARVGGRLSKAPTGSEGINATSFYGKLYLVHGFRKKQSVHFKDAFRLGAFGSSLEAGLGFNARLSPKFVLHGDVVYQQKLTKAGFSGASFSGGLRYQF
ncbi:autotransporter outer membrane beta-barrel domain-containing protein [Bartonella koehlerae]|uniref:Outer membrane autotransporter barrel domain-containing protein n=1 Tax=Bartonella koehlerae C-29 TaxID=1134510 RepID=A0A067W2J4_9HYPH|nr:autotransporter outer membrane beta-barrel domain-containing protein [Bartonella koehlerae]KEC54010.1 outer membrane autotransporter barrel domain-containing protein [Bartonella koehlerae C-29]